ncbi:hypothetical protein GALL_340040 [mine drainage metagenome]|uniref:Uncharacterized protein n=1 Tax=mine drainage metagenome TaxID=410659 RepID=A0A1J5QKZ1_9ZZZZ
MQGLHGVLRGLRDHAQPVREGAAAHLQGVGGVGQIEVGMGLEMRGQLCGHGVQRRRALGREREQLRADGGRRRRRRGGLFQHHVGVGAAHAEAADPGAARLFAARPGREPAADHEGAAGEIDAGIRRGVVDAGRQGFVRQGQGRLDHPRGSGGDDHVADVALERADAAKARVGRVLAERARERLDFHRVAHWGGGAMGFDIAHAARVDVGVALGGGDHGGLAVHAGGGEAGLVAAVVVDGHAANDGQYRVAVGQRIRQAFEQHHGGAVGEHRALGLGVETARGAVGREHRAVLVEVAAVGRTGHRAAAGQRHVALARAQAGDGLRDGHQRGGTGGVHADRRAGEVESVGHARGDVVLLVAQHGLEGAERLDEVGPVLHVMLEVGGVVHAGEHAHRHGRGIRRAAGAFQAFPAQLQEDALLRVHQRGLARGDAEEGGVEQIDAVDHAARFHVVGVLRQAGGQAGVELVGAEMGDGVAPVQKVGPERFDVGRAGKAPGNGHDGDRGMARIGRRRAGRGTRRLLALRGRV